MEKQKKPSSFTYASSGVDIAAKDEVLLDVERTLKTDDKRVLNSVGAFATLYDGKFPEYEHPVLVMKTEEPGSKQLLAFQHDRVESICADMVNHLINDIIVMGAKPLAMQDAVICGKLDKNIVKRIVAGVAAACTAQECVLTGGETSEQPGVIPEGTYILTASIVGVVEKAKVIDGSKVKDGDVVLAIASNGLHTNGYSLVRRLMKEKPEILNTKVDQMSFLDAILLPHLCFYKTVKGILGDSGLHGMAHITGSGIEGNLERILPKSVNATIDLSSLRVLPIFTAIRDAGEIADAEMLRTYNMGVGLTLIVDAKSAEKIQSHIKKQSHDCYPIGNIVKGNGKVTFEGTVTWSA
ncbi:phosphoribosylformylglycinamidine cyclo-ligase [Candidatus Peribacteria bacterium]|nr:phosphoribosylformylglycinamidine cyclo-ligase [Candidatus Peribacteria bacterium]